MNKQLTSSELTLGEVLVEARNRWGDFAFVRETLSAPTEKQLKADKARIEMIEAELGRWEGYAESPVAMARLDELIEAARFVLDGGARNFPQLADVVEGSQRYRKAMSDRCRLETELKTIRSNGSPARSYEAGKKDSVYVEADTLEKLIVAIRRR